MESTSIFGSIIFFILLILGVGGISYALVLSTVSGGFKAPKSNNSSSYKRIKEVVKPVIAYKQATLLKSGNFRGVSGKVHYSSNESVSEYSPGFHAFSDISKAKLHEQRGNVILEVLLSGRINEHELGYTATQQRVLQIIAKDCHICGKPSSYFHFNKDEVAIGFVCNKHKSIFMHGIGLIYEGIFEKTNFDHGHLPIGLPTKRNVYKISEMHKLVKFKWIEDEKILVRALSGVNAPHLTTLA